MSNAYLLPFFVMQYMMFIGCFSFYYHPPDRITLGSLVGIVCWISAVCGMVGSVEKAMLTLDGTRKIIWCKYAEYAINTPMLTAIMCESWGVPPNKTLRLTSLSASYCLCGLGAILTTRLWLQIYFVLLGCVLCLFVGFCLIQVSRHPPSPSKVALINLYMMCISYPLVVLTWGMSDIFHIMTPAQEFLYETMLMVAIKTTALLYVIGDEEYYQLSNCIWELPQHVFYVARSLVYNHVIHIHMH